MVETEQQINPVPKVPVPDWDHYEDPTRLYNSFEFGPAWWFHVPMFLSGIYWAVRLRKANFFAAANPNLENGGLYNYSKFAAQNHFPVANIPATLLVNSNEDATKIWERIRLFDIGSPFIVKPDFGERGKGVKLLGTFSELEQYLKAVVNQNLIIQEFIDVPEEYGVFFVVDPERHQLSIPSLTKKIPLQVIGNGQSTISELIVAHPRVSRYQGLLEVYESVPAAGEKVNLSPMGNHCKGAVFLDYSERINAEIVGAFQHIFDNVKGIHYGRLDVKVNQFGDLSNPELIKILEVNGANAEPIHMYSPDKNYKSGLKTIHKFFGQMADVAEFYLRKDRRKFNTKENWKSLISYFGK